MPFDPTQPYEVEGRKKAGFDPDQPFTAEEAKPQWTERELKGAQLAGEQLAQEVFPDPTEEPSTFAKSRYALAQGVAGGFADVMTALKSAADPGPFNKEKFRRAAFEQAMADPMTLPQTVEEAMKATTFRDPSGDKLQKINEAYDSFRQSQTKYFETAREFYGDYATAAQEVRQNTPGNERIAQTAAGAGSMGATVVAAPIPGGGIAVSAMQSYGNAKDEALTYYKKIGLPEKEAENLSDEVARLNAISTGYVTALTPHLFGGKLLGKGVEAWTKSVLIDRLKKTPAVTQAVEEVLKEVMGEATEEGLDQAIQGAVAMRYHRPDMTWKQAAKEAIDAAVAGGVSAGALKAPMAGAALAHKPLTKAQEAAKMAGAFVKEQVSSHTTPADVEAINALRPENAQVRGEVFDPSKPYQVESMRAQPADVGGGVITPALTIEKPQPVVEVGGGATVNVEEPAAPVAEPATAPATAPTQPAAPTAVEAKPLRYFVDHEGKRGGDWMVRPIVMEDGREVGGEPVETSLPNKRDAEARRDELNQSLTKPGQTPPAPGYSGKGGEWMLMESTIRVHQETLEAGRFPNGKKLTDADRARLGQEIEAAENWFVERKLPLPESSKAHEIPEGITGPQHAPEFDYSNLKIGEQVKKDNWSVTRGPDFISWTDEFSPVSTEHIDYFQNLDTGEKWHVANNGWMMGWDLSPKAALPTLIHLADEWQRTHSRADNLNLLARARVFGIPIGLLRKMTDPNNAAAAQKAMMKVRALLGLPPQETKGKVGKGERSTVNPEPAAEPAVEAHGQPDVEGAPGLDAGEPTGTDAGVVPTEPTEAAPGRQGDAGAGLNPQGEGTGRKRSRSKGANLPQPDISGAAGTEGGGGTTPTAGNVHDATGAVAPKPARAPVAVEDQNHSIAPGDTLVPGGDKAKTRANVAAIRLLKTLEAENRNPTPDEKKVLAQYVGWGGLAPAFDSGKAAYRERSYFYSDEQETEYKRWEKEWGATYNELKELLTPEEYSAAKGSTVNAHYTSREVVDAMWQMAEKLGFTGGQVLESSAGIGNFLGLEPRELAGRTKWNAVELDSVSGRMLAKLYPQARVQNTGFESAKFALNAFDLVIGNPPFAKEGPYDPRYPKLSLHNYFLARSLDLLKPGGLLVNISSASTMDNDSSRKARELFAEKADLVGAIRLPNNAFKKNAGTEVTTDILIFRKKDGNPFEAAHPFLNTKATETAKGETVHINEYFADHPEMMLGKMGLEGTMYGPDQPALTAIPGADLKEQLHEALGKLPENVAGSKATVNDFSEIGEAADSASKEGAVVAKPDGAYVVQDGVLKKPDWGSDRVKVERAKAYVEGRELAKELIGAQFDPDATDANIEALRKKLNTWYDAYTRKHGALNAAKTRFLEDDPEFPLMLALENVETVSLEKPILTGKNKGKIRSVREERFHKAEIFNKRTIFPRLAPERADTAADAVAISIAYKNNVDVPYVAKLLATTPEQAEATLLASNLAFKNPGSGLLETPDAYLSGFVREKLRQAEQAAADDPAYARNVEALRKVIPEPIPIEQITFRLGVPWMPPKHIQSFLKDVLGVEARVSYEPHTQSWAVSPYAGSQNSKNTTTYGSTFMGHELVEQSLNLKNATVYDTVPGDTPGTTRQERNPEKTLAAQDKQEQLKKLFVDWARKSEEASRDIYDIYNENFNGTVLRKFEGPAWEHYPGASQTVKLRPHQKAVVSRILQNSTLLAHAVGTGKTFVMITSAMEMRRLGMAKKPMIVTQNATTKQFAAAFKKLYPTSRVLVPTEKDRRAENRNRIMSRIATGEWDAVIVPQSFINMMPDDPARVAGYIDQRKKELEDARIEAAAAEGKRSPKVKQLEKALKALETRLEKLEDRRKDNVMNFEQLGVDALMVDEAHAYKKLEFTTKMDNVKGLDRGASQRGFGMLMKTRFVQERNAGKNVVFATGTPISNTLAEAWNMIRYIRPDVLSAYHMENFDDFASTFGETVAQLEMTAGGTWKVVSRFAKFTNGPELISAFHTAADVVLPEDVNLPGVPGLENGRPTNMVVPQTPQVSSYVQTLRKMLQDFEEMSGRQKRDNSHIPLVVFGLAKKASLDMRLVNPDLKDEPGSKLNVAVGKIKEIYDETEDDKGTQMVFADSYQSANEEPYLDPEKTKPNPAYGKRFNLYDEIKRKLVDKGVPANEIAIITDYDTDAKRETLFGRVVAGQVRIMIGSSEKMGVGVNVQDRLYGLHHLDAPPRPMDVEQRNGRILRQGNMWASIGDGTVKIFTYGVENTLDAAMFQKLATKQKFINQVLRGDISGRNFEDSANEQSLTFEEQMAAFSGDPLALEKVTLENRLRQLESLRQTHENAANKAKVEGQQLVLGQIPKMEERLKQETARAASLARTFAGDLSVNVGGKITTGKEVPQALDELFKSAVNQLNAFLDINPQKKNQFSIENPVGVIQVNGVPVDLVATGHLNMDGTRDVNRPTEIGWRFADQQYGRNQVTTGLGFVASLRAELKRAENQPGTTAAEIDRQKKNAVELAGFAKQPFERASELEDVKSQLADVVSKLAPTQQAQAEVESAVDRIREALNIERSEARMVSEGGTAVELARQRLASGAAYGNVNMLGMQSMFELVRDLATVGGDLLRRGYRQFAAWQKQMVRMFGDKVRRWLPQAWQRTQNVAAAQALNLSPEGVATVNRIEAISERINRAPEIKPVYPAGKYDNFLRKAGRLSRRLVYFGSPELLRAKQQLDLRESYQAAAVKEQSNRLLRMIEESAYEAQPDGWKLPKWMRMGGWARRLREFKKLALPIAAHLNATGKANGSFVFSDFEMRAGLMPARQFKDGGHKVGDVIMAENPLTGEDQELTIGNLIETVDGRTGYQLTRQMTADQQQEIYNHYNTQWPEFMWLTDIFIDPDLRDVRFKSNGVEVPVFNRFALASKMAENSASFTPVDAYTPDVLISRSLMGSVKGALGLRRGTRSPGRKYKSGAARESGDVRDLLTGFNIRTFQALQETARRDFFQAVLKHGAVPITGGVVPEGYVNLETGMSEVWNAIKRLRRLDLGEKLTLTNDPQEAIDNGHEVREVNGQSFIVERKFPETEARLQEGGDVGDFRKFIGEAAQLRGKQMMIPAPLVDLLVRKYAAYRSHGRLFNMLSWMIRNSTQLFLAHPKTYVANVLTNDLFSVEAAYRYALAGSLKVLSKDSRLTGKRDLRLAANILGGMALNRFKGLRELLHVADDTKYMRTVREVLPDQIFADSTQLADVKVKYDDSPFELLKKGEIGGAVLQGIKYGAIDVRAKQRLAYAYLKANAVTIAKEAGLTGQAMRDAVSKRMANPPVDERAHAVAAANFEYLNYSDSPDWLNRFARNDLGRLVLPFPRFGYHFLAKQGERLSALKLFIGKVPKGERANAMADLMTVATFGLGGGGLLLHAAVKALFGVGDDDDDPRKYVGTSSIKYVDTDGSVKTKALDRELVTSNRINLSYWLHHGGIDKDDDNDFWLRVRNYPVVAMAGAAVLAQHDAKKFGLGHGVATYFSTVTDLGSDFFSLGMALKVPDKVVASLRSLEAGKPVAPLLDPYATRVPLTAYLTEQSMDSIVPGSRQADELLMWLDRQPRRKTESKELGYEPGVWESLRTSHITGVADRLLAALGHEETSLPAAGPIETVPLHTRPGEKFNKRALRIEGSGILASGRPEANVYPQVNPTTGKISYRMALVPEANRPPTPTVSLLSSLAGFNVRPVPRQAYESALEPKPPKVRY